MYHYGFEGFNDSSVHKVCGFELQPERLNFSFYELKNGCGPISYNSYMGKSKCKVKVIPRLHHLQGLSCPVRTIPGTMPEGKGKCTKLCILSL